MTLLVCSMIELNDFINATDQFIDINSEHVKTQIKSVLKGVSLYDWAEKGHIVVA